MLDSQLLPSETDAASLQSETDAAKLALFKHLKAEISTMPAEESKPQSKHPPLIAAVVALGLLAVLAWGLRARDGDADNASATLLQVNARGALRRAPPPRAHILRAQHCFQPIAAASSNAC